MCGRTACTLAPDDLVRACCFRDKKGKRRLPVWKECPSGKKYIPSYNVPPSSHTPVLLSSKHYPGELDSLSERVIQPMRWGLVPSWRQEDPYKPERNLTNCRAEGMLSKPTFKASLQKGNRCVILADGFFEWKRLEKMRSEPYYIYFPQKETTSESDIKPVIKKEAGSKSVKSKSQVLKQSAKNPEQNPVKIKPDPDSTCRPMKKEDVQPASSAFKTDTFLELTSTEKLCVPKEKSETLSPVKIKKEKGLDTDSKSDAARKGFTAEQSAMKGQFTHDWNSVKSDNTEDQAEDEEEEWKGRRLMTMAGLFHVWHPPGGSFPMYSYSIITVEACPIVSWIHNRMPAILSTEEEISNWLDFADVPLSEAVKVIQPTESPITMHRVSWDVNNVKNKSPRCVELFDPREGLSWPRGSSLFMSNWLNKGKRIQENDPPSKKHKAE